MQQPFDITGGVTKLGGRKRSTRRKPKREEVTANIQESGLPQAVAGCDPNVFTSVPTFEENVDLPISHQEKELIMSKARQKLENLPSVVLENITFSVFGHEDLQKIAAFTVTNDNDEGPRSVNDPRSGVVEYNQVCQKCHQDNLTCPGHYGIIELNHKIIHPMFYKEVIYILTSVCNSCGGLLLTEDQLRIKGLLDMPSGSKKLKAIADASQGIPCRRQPEMLEEDVARCIPNPNYITSKTSEVGKIIYTRDKKAKKGKEGYLTVDKVYDILDAISDEDARLLGFSSNSHPRRFVLRSIPVVPLCARPPVVQNGQMLPDDLTSMYKDIVKYNQALAEKFEGRDAEKQKDDAIRRLIYSVSHMIDNADKTYGQNKRKEYMDIKSRIQGKEAIIRGMIMGKRVNFSARTVLGPDPNLKFGQIRVPEVMAPYLTRVEKVIPANLGRLTQLFRAGKVTHVIPAKGYEAGKRLRVTDKKRQEYRLRYGDTVWRWLQNGDYVVFNRQPSLHKQSMMGYEVVLGKPMTFGLHLSATSPHNAD